MANYARSFIYGGNTIDLSVPRGLIAWKYIDFRDNDEFPEMGMTGPYATAKSTAALDFLIRRAIEYPGSNTLIARGTLSSLKNSTLDKMTKRLGAIFDSGNENEAIYRLPPDTDPMTGQDVQSIIKGIGLDRIDLEQVFRSTEYMTGFIEEGDEVDSRAHDNLQARLRQIVFHRTLKVYHLAMKMAERWSQHYDGVLTPEDAYEIMRADKRHPVGQNELAWEDPMPGSTVLKTAWNPKPGDHLWDRYIGIAHPGVVTPDWVEANVGIREVHVRPDRLRRDKFFFRAGSIVKLNSGVRQFAARHDEKKGEVHLIDGRVIPEKEANLVVQRACIYAFKEENESRNFQNDENSYLMVNTDLQEQAFMGIFNGRQGRVFTNYIDDYVENGGHLLHYPGKEALVAAKYRGFGGIDQGGGHATGMIAGLIAPESGIALVYDEYMRSGVAAAESVHDAKAMVLPNAPEFWWGYDPAMENKRYDKDVEYSTIQEYQSLGNLMPGDRGKEAFDYVNGLLAKRDTFIGSQAAPRLLIFDNCTYLRQTARDLTWKMVDTQRNLWMVDVGDAFKIALSIFRRLTIGGASMSEAAIIHAPAAYSTKFAD